MEVDDIEDAYADPDLNVDTEFDETCVCPNLVERVKSTCYALIKERGYKNLTSAAFVKKDVDDFAWSLDFNTSCGDVGQIMLFERALTDSDINMIQIDKVGIKVILICQDITRKQKAKLSNLPMELFMMTDLLLNVLDHQLVPKYTLVTNEVVDGKIDGIPIHELPRILLSDPVVRFKGFVKGDVVKIVSSTSDWLPGENKDHSSYRLVSS